MKIPVWTTVLKRAGFLSLKGAETPVCDTDRAGGLLLQLIGRTPVEELAVLYLGPGQQLLGAEVVARGGRQECSIQPVELFRGAIVAGAQSIILGHNHPSGEATCSAEDLKLTVKVIELGDLLGIRVEDHLVVSARTNRYCSVMASFGLGEEQHALPG